MVGIDETVGLLVLMLKAVMQGEEHPLELRLDKNEGVFSKLGKEASVEDGRGVRDRGDPEALTVKSEVVV